MLTTPTHSFFIVKKQLYDPKRDQSNRGVNTFFFGIDYY
jgi:hypothetical protein